MDEKTIIAAKLAEWDMSLTESEIEQLVPAYDNLLRWQEVVHGMLRSRKIAYEQSTSWHEQHPNL